MMTSDPPFSALSRAPNPKSTTDNQYSRCCTVAIRIVQKYAQHLFKYPTKEKSVLVVFDEMMVHTDSGVSRVWQAWLVPWAPVWWGRKNWLAKIKIS